MSVRVGDKVPNLPVPASSLRLRSDRNGSNMTKPTGKPRGRPPGSKNASTLLREGALKELKGKWSDILAKDTEKVLRAVVQRALDGDMTAAKMVLDRTIPAEKGDGGGERQRPSINIVIEGTAPPALTKGVTIEETSNEQAGSPCREKRHLQGS